MFEVADFKSTCKSKLINYLKYYLNLLIGWSKGDFTESFVYKMGSQLNEFEDPPSQKYFKQFLCRTEYKTPDIPGHAPLIWGLVTCSQGRAFSAPQLSLSGSWKENAIQLHILLWWTFITQLISRADVFIHSSGMSSTVASVSIRLFPYQTKHKAWKISPAWRV